MPGQPDRRGRRPEVARPIVDRLEARMLLDGTPIASGQVSSILTSLRALGSVGARIDADAAIINAHGCMS